MPTPYPPSTPSALSAPVEGGQRGATRCALWLLLATAASLAWATPAPAQVPAPDSDGDGLSDSEELALGTRVLDPDTDGDGLLDGWEVHGRDVGGFLEPLPIYGADPLRMDVFVEIDWMTAPGEEPMRNAVIAYQAAADVTRVFRRSGAPISIHFDLGPNVSSWLPEALREEDLDVSAFDVEPDLEKRLPYQDLFEGRPSWDAPSTRITLYQAYSAGRFFRPSRRNAFYYVVIAEQALPLGGGPAESSLTHPYTDSFSDALARRDGLEPSGTPVGVVFRNPAPTLDAPLLRFQYSSTLLHELGHAFGLGHGGAKPGFRWDNSNWKPNYPSVMNYRFQFCGVDMADGVPVMDFSHGALHLPLRESALIELVGMGATVGGTVLRCVGVAPLAVAAFPASLDWNGDGVLTLTSVARDLNDNGKLDEAALTDHDDWSQFQQEGFDGIGILAHHGCGLACDKPLGASRLLGDFNGDGRTDTLLVKSGRLAWMVAAKDGALEIVKPGGEPAPAPWNLRQGDRMLALDLLRKGRDQVILHHGNELAILELVDGATRLAWYEDGSVPVGDPDQPGGWVIDTADSYLGVLLGPKGLPSLLVQRGSRLGVLSLLDEAVGEPALAWTAPDGLLRQSGLSLRPGRRLAEGGASALVLGPRTLIEVTAIGEDGDVGIQPLASELSTGGVLPGEGAAAERGWWVRSDDKLVMVDLDGDGADECLLLGTDSLGLLERSKDGSGAWRDLLSPDLLAILGGDTLPRDLRLLRGRLLPGGGEELLAITGGRWVVLGWRADEGRLEALAAADRRLGEDFPLDRSQPVLVGRFLPFPEAVILVHGGSRLLLARPAVAAVDGQLPGFEVLLEASQRVGDWILSDSDILQPANLDADPEQELLVRAGDLQGVLDFWPAPTTRFLGRLEVEALAFIDAAVFFRGDANGDRELDVSDVIVILSYLFLGQATPSCLDAIDVNDNGELSLSDPIYLLNYLYSGGPPVPPPALPIAGVDPTLDQIGCDG